MAENKDGTAIDSFLDRGFLFAGGNMDISEMKKEALQAIAAETMSSTPGAMHLRTLSTINDISSDQSNTIIFCLPIEVLEAIKGKSINEDVIKKITKKDN